MKLILLSFITGLALAGGTNTTEHVDLAGTALFDKTKLLTRVEKNVDVEYEYLLSSNNIWTQFPDMAMEFNLDFDQYVYIKYNIATVTSVAAIFSTRLIIDEG